MGRDCGRDLARAAYPWPTATETANPMQTTNLAPPNEARRFAAPDDDRCTPARIQEWLTSVNTDARPSCPKWCDGAHAARFEVRPDDLINVREDDLAELEPQAEHEAVMPLPCGGNISIYYTETPSGWIDYGLNRPALYISFCAMPQYLDASKDLTALVKAARVFAAELEKVADRG